jgi:hypothetical protein
MEGGGAWGREEGLKGTRKTLSLADTAQTIFSQVKNALSYLC